MYSITSQVSQSVSDNNEGFPLKFGLFIIIDIGERQEVGDIKHWRVLEESCDGLEGVYGGIHGVSVVGGNISVSI